MRMPEAVWSLSRAPSGYECFPWLTYESRQEQEFSTPVKARVLRQPLRVRPPKLDHQRRARSRPHHHAIPWRSQAKCCEGRLGVFLRAEDTLGRRHLQETQATLEALDDLRWHGGPRSAPRPCRRARKALLVIAGAHLHLDDLLHAQLEHDATRLETHQARIRSAPMPGEDHNQAGRESCPSHPGSTLQRRRRHHTTPPIAATRPGSPSTVMAKIP